MGKLKAKSAPHLIVVESNGGDSRLDRLAAAIAEVRTGRRLSPRTAKLLAAGAPKIAQKVIEEAGEVSIEAVRGDRHAVILESVDLFYNLLALWSEIGVKPDEVWAEMDRREAAMGMAEKLPKAGGEDTHASD
jgi:phosphoribosyl-ATP pyrophosphohydrolase